jgi:two-component system sensor histidine kinase DegS
VTVEVRASWPRRDEFFPSRLWRGLVGSIRRFPQRLRERRFWHVQLLVLGATVPHYVIETAGYTNPFETLHGLSITLYILPLLYAAFNYGWEGAVLTAFWSAALTSPSTWIWHRSGFHWFTEVGQLVVTLPVGILVAWRVDLETKQRLKAERTSASLSLLNEIGESLSHTLEVEQQLPHVLRRLLSGLSLESVWLCLEPESAGGQLLVIEESSGRDVPSPKVFAGALHARVASVRGGTIQDSHMVVAPLVIEGGMLGSLGATLRRGEAFADEQTELLATVAHQIQVAVENARLYRQRQESLQSYVRQVTHAQEEERRRIARELHDETAQELVHLVRKLEQLRDAADLTKTTEDLLTIARGTLQSVRRYSRDLRPSILDDLGLVAAIEMVVEEANGRLPSGARLMVTGTPRRVDGPVELALFRIAQEALRNVEKHAQAASAKVDLDFRSAGIQLSMADDGLGFAPPKNISDLARVGKLGLLGMKERAELVGGSLEVHSIPGKGTRLVVRVKAGIEPSA